MVRVWRGVASVGCECIRAMAGLRRKLYVDSRAAGRTEKISDGKGRMGGVECTRSLREDKEEGDDAQCCGREMERCEVRGGQARTGVSERS
jgi:hypothetical protein